MSVASQDVYLNVTTPLSVIGSGGGGSVPANLVASTLTLGANGTISGVSTINGVVPGAAVVPANLTASTLTLGVNGTISGVSTINGVVPGAAAVPGNLLVSTLTVGASTISGVSTINGVPYGAAVVPANLTVSTLVAASTISVGASPSVLLTDINSFNPANPAGTISFNNGLQKIVTSGLNTANAGPIDLDANIGGGGTRLQLGSGGPDAGWPSNQIRMTGALNVSSILSVSSINSAAYPPAALPNATLSTLALSTLGVPIGIAPFSTMQVVNSRIGDLRIQSGVAEATVAGVVVTFQTPFGANPVVTTGVVSVSGTNVNAVVSGAGPTQATFSVDTVGVLLAVPVTYTAIGLA
jgi:hypothetical protein